jgi:PAS domain S-box-containing protein
MRDTFSHLQSMLIDPLRPMKNPTELQQARLLSLILVVLVPLGAAAIFLYQFLLPGRPSHLDRMLLLTEITGTAVMMVAYAFNRAGRYRLAAWLTLMLMSITVLIVSCISLDQYNSFSDSLCVMVPITIASVLLRFRHAALFCCANILLAAMAPFMVNSASGCSEIYGIVGYLVLLSSLIFVIAWHRNRLEAVRQRELRSSAQKYRLLAEKMSDVVFIQDLDLKLQYISPSVKDIFGYTSEEALRTRMQDMLTPDSLGRMHEIFNQHVNLATQGPVDLPLMEFEYVRRDGTTFRGEFRAAFLYDDKGHLIGSQGVLRDITERKEAERQKAAYEERLSQSDKMQAIGQLAGGVAHDFNSQLTGIRGCAELLSQSLRDDQELRELAQTILKAADHSARLTGQLLAFARKGAVQSVPLDLHAIVNEVIAILKRSIDKRIVLHTRLDAGTSVISGDPSQLQNMLLNIALNARDAMPQGGEMTFSSRTIMLDAGYCSTSHFPIEPGRHIAVCIADTGFGMDDGTRKRMFEPFFTTKEKGKGTGMGLAAVYGTVRSHKGTLEVDSLQGKGTAFTILLPLADIEGGGHAGQDQAQEKSGPISILVIEDEPIVAKATCRMLEMMGHRVRHCANGQEALETFRSQARLIDLIFLDMVMPQLSGKEVFGQLVKIDPRVRVIVMSGYSEEGDAMMLLTHGAAGFLQKPFTIDELAESVEKAVGRKQRPE